MTIDGTMKYNRGNDNRGQIEKREEIMINKMVEIFIQRCSNKGFGDEQELASHPKSILQ